ncbi:MAG: hypothetical protein WC755_05310 [Candidatus Woesearchaeota archaeon]|jgi:hypothetical protein
MKYKHNGINLKNTLSVPFIWLLLVPLLILDLIGEIYHRICFPLYGLKCVKRKEYIIVDSYKLPYLSWMDKIYCLYCEYANGLLPYMSKIAAETEKYWCGIKHRPSKEFHQPKHHKDFLEYGNEEEFKKFCKMQKKKNSSR